MQLPKLLDAEAHEQLIESYMRNSDLAILIWSEPALQVVVDVHWQQSCM